MKVICFGKVSVYEPRGDYQLIVVRRNVGTAVSPSEFFRLLLRFMVSVTEQNEFGAMFSFEQGADGWRLDVPTEIDDDDFWAEFRQVVHSANPEACLIGQVTLRFVDDG